LFVLCFILPIIPVLVNEAKKMVISNMGKKQPEIALA
jgi:hypothetical protein